MTLPIYSTGTVSVSADGTVVTGVGTNWSSVNAREGDEIYIDRIGPVPILEVTDTTHLVIPSWAGGAKAGASYFIVPRSASRFLGLSAIEDYHRVTAALSEEGYYLNVPSDRSVPDPSHGYEGQYARQYSTGKEWVRADGVWNYRGKAAGEFFDKTPWSSTVTYAAGVIVPRGLNLYRSKANGNLNYAPESNAAWWELYVPIVDDYVFRGETLISPPSGGVVDAAPTIQAAAANTSLRRIRIPPGTYLLNSSITPNSNQMWDIAGCTFILPDGLSIAWLWQYKEDFAMLGPFTIEGGNTADFGTNGTTKGIQIQACKRGRIVSPTLKNIKGWGIYCPGEGLASGTLRGDRIHIVNPTFLKNWIGYQDTAGASAEYSLVTGIMASGNQNAVITAAGNTMFEGGNIVDNFNGVYVGNGINHAHGIFMGLQINHNTNRNLYAVGVTNGFTATGNHFYGNNAGSDAIEFAGCAGCILEGGVIDCGVRNSKDSASGDNFLKNVHFPGSFFSRNGTGGNDQLVILGGTGPGIYSAGLASTLNDPAEVYCSVIRTDASPNQDLTTEGYLLFPTVVYDRKGIYNPANGRMTVPTGKGGIYRFEAMLHFFGSDMNQSNSYAALYLNGAPLVLGAMQVFVGARAGCKISSELKLVAGDYLQIWGSISNVTGSDRKFGGTAFRSQMTLTKIA